MGNVKKEIIIYLKNNTMKTERRSVLKKIFASVVGVT